MRSCISALFILLMTLIPASLFTHAANAQSLGEKLAAENPTKLAEQALRDGNIVRGAILFHQGSINCATCHRSTAERDRIGPDLSRMDETATDGHLIESILQPSKQIKKGFEAFTVLTNDGLIFNGIKVKEDEQQIVLRDSADVNNLITIAKNDVDEIRPSNQSSMPDGLADQLKNRQQFLDLLRYVIDIRERGPGANSPSEKTTLRRELSPRLEGLVLIQDLNCVACHEPGSFQSPVVAKKAPRLEWSGSKLNPNYIEKFIANPHSVKPKTAMPEILGQLNAVDRKKEATAITHFLLSKTQNNFQAQPIDGEAMHRGFDLFNSVGCVACHAPRNESATEQTVSETPPLGDLSGKYNVAGLTELLKDPLAVRPSGHMPDMRLTHREAVDISNFLLQAQADIDPPTAWNQDPEQASVGEALFKKHNCASCHSEITGKNETFVGKLTLAQLNPEAGCLSGKTGAWPNFHLNDEQITSIRAALQIHPMQFNRKEQIEVTLKSFNCIACHDRGDFGGVTTERNPHFKTTNLNLGDQGRIPPTLTGIGAKLNPKWMRDVLVNRRSIRPYMNTRMPQYGEDNVGHLLELFESSDKIADSTYAKFKDQNSMREKGHLLAGHKGLNCVACHTYQYKVSDTMPAVDLTEMTERLKKDWFYQYMLAPQTFSPNTVMPSFWPGGKAIRADIEGTPEDQIEALWQYLIDGRQARAPSGVVREPLEIVVTDEAQMLRRSYPGIGKRGIGVGYPGGVNIAFDAEQLRLATLWRGKFAEASGVWRGQGSGTVRPMSRPIEFAKGPDLDNAIRNPVAERDRPPNHHFKGYNLDKSRRPTFRYSFDAIDVEDFFSQLKDETSGKTQLRRSVTLTTNDKLSGRKELSFRIANAAEITGADGLFSIGKNLKIRILSNHSAKLAVAGEGNCWRYRFSSSVEKKKSLNLNTCSNSLPSS